jgi:hypothetical protein
MKDLHSELVLWRHVGGLPSISEKLLDEVSNVLSGDGDVLDRGADNVALSDGDSVCPAQHNRSTLLLLSRSRHELAERLTGDTVSRIDDDSGQVPIRVSVRPTGSESENGLDGDVETLWTSERLGQSVVQGLQQGSGKQTWTLKDSNMISAVFSRFSGGLRGGSVCSAKHNRSDQSIESGERRARVRTSKT